ncbi:MAG: hypothetical protein DRI36_00335 [Caldiserica bacterium]|nr:MAG: hypothetical protein DRI36_00335 [Caldisericota bacterium]
MVKFIFMLGRPGCGKSYLFKNVFTPVLEEKGYEVERVDDFPILKKLLSEDKEFKRHVRKEGGFEVTDWSIVDEVLKEMDKVLKDKEEEGKVILVEFARDNYKKAISNFSDYVREKTLLLYIWAPFELCLERNKSRFERGKDIDDHIVPTDLMFSYYKTDDLEKVFLENRNSLPDEFYGWKIRFFNNEDSELPTEKKREIFKSLIEGVL